MQSKSVISNTISKNVKLIVALSFSIIIVAFLKISGILIIKKVVDEINTLNSLAFWVVMFVLSVSIYYGLDSLKLAQTYQFSNRVNNGLKKAIYSSGLRAELSELNKIDKESILNNLFKNSDKIAITYITNNIISFINEVIVMLTVLITSIVINPILTMILFGSLPIYYVISKAIDRLTNKSNNKFVTIAQKSEHFVYENFDKIRNIKLKNGVLQEEEDFQNWLDHYSNTFNKNQNMNYTNKFGIPTLLTGLMITIIIGLGGMLTRTNINNTSIGDVVAFSLLTPIVFTSFRIAINCKLSSNCISQELIGIERFINVRSEIKNEPITSLEEVHSLKFKDIVYISNDDTTHNLIDLSFEIKRGEKLGILSLEGYAKDTIFDLMTKIIRPKNGQISINNCDINRMDTFYLRSLVTAIPEDDKLFNDTIANNITYPLQFDEYQYNDALNRSGLKDLINKFSNKDQYVINENDPELTDDIKQRIVLANAFYKDSKIFILNDATSSMDPKSEDEIMREIYNLKNKIIIIMSEHSYNLLNCDKIIILENSNVLEYGVVSELLQDRNSLLYKQIKKGKIAKSRVS